MCTLNAPHLIPTPTYADDDIKSGPSTNQSLVGFIECAKGGSAKQTSVSAPSEILAWLNPSPNGSRYSRLIFTRHYTQSFHGIGRFSRRGCLKGGRRYNAYNDENR